MAEETFRPRKITQEDLGEIQSTMSEGEALRKAAAKDIGEDFERNPSDTGMQIKGAVPKAFMDAVRQKKAETEIPHHGRERARQTKQPMSSNGSSELSKLLEGLKGAGDIFEALELPSKGKFYDGEDGPANGVIHVRAMTGEEEQILATPRFVKKGQAINMIFQRCMQEQYRTEELLTIDRTYLLIWLRGISYTPQYDVEVKCPECDKRFSTVIDLNSLYVDQCPDDFGSVDLSDTLPKSGYHFTYRLSRGKDEQEIQEYRDRRVKIFGDSSTDDTLTYRTAMLLENIEGVADKRELMILVKSLPIQDVSHIRNCINEPPFGVDTSIPISCPMCMHEFEVDLPLEANFFFPRRKKKDKTQA